ncbi:hypothetical protein GCM10009641_47680 [Mycobacterium cookii]|uniref:Uncharacterized protein n=1 Tax=Mycobacterium cookii TaxID=1775 RepID=A0A7I7KXB0_9MYCO|nr:hypothetical protein [Mycobacterium cookii]MCV7332795.1 hypothetical protein [Mycobacterium cookii]BBX46181.1 hypothetical protein MCOO_21960 [Mycobacterium cookii]
MAAPASPLPQLHRPARLPRAASARTPAADFGRYQFQVVAADIADAVTSIGGLIFDRAMAGWDVSVVVDGDHVIDDRPVRILGARVTLVPDRLAVLPAPQMLAVAGDVIVKSEAVRRQVLAAGEDAVTEVLLWGRAHPPSLNCKYIPVRHRPSAAAQVFKSHAMAAGGATVAEAADEGFYSMV